MSGYFPTIDFKSNFYLGCKKKRDINKDALCKECPFRAEIERQESLNNPTIKEDTNIEKEE